MDGTLTQPRGLISEYMRKWLNEKVRPRAAIALVGGSDLAKICEQMNGTFEQVTDSFDYVFSENGVVGFKGRQPYPVLTIADKLGEPRLQSLINYSLHYIADLKLPAKRGTFVEYRKSMLNISPIGRSCSQVDRDQFVAYNRQHQVLETFATNLRTQFPVDTYGLQFSIGGQISVDVFPVGWDKSYALQYLKDEGYTEIHFFGDKTQLGGNDHEIFMDARTIGHTVTGPDNTMAQVNDVLDGGQV